MGPRPRGPPGGCANKLPAAINPAISTFAFIDASWRSGSDAFLVPRYRSIARTGRKVPEILPRLSWRLVRWRRGSGKMDGMRTVLASILALGLLSAAEIKLGKPLTVKEPMPLATLLAHPDDYVGKTVQVKGKIVEVCQMMGCWMDLTNDAGQKLRIKVNDGEIDFPKDAAGKMAVAEGRFTKSELTKEQAIARAREEAEEKGKAFDAASVQGPVTVYQIQGSGALILTN
jgi:hypothetical protein